MLLETPRPAQLWGHLEHNFEVQFNCLVLLELAFEIGLEGLEFPFDLVLMGLSFHLIQHSWSFLKNWIRAVHLVLLELPFELGSELSI